MHLTIVEISNDYIMQVDPVQIFRNILLPGEADEKPCLLDLSLMS